MDLIEELDSLPVDSLVKVESEAGLYPLSVVQQRGDGLIHCCYGDCADMDDVCCGAVFDEITGRELEPHALPELVFKEGGDRIVEVLSRR